MAEPQEGGMEISLEAPSLDSSGESNHPLMSPEFVSPNGQSLSEQDRQKIYRILEACTKHDIELLAELASSDGGLIDDETRRRACKDT